MIENKEQKVFLHDYPTTRSDTHSLYDLNLAI